MTAIDITLIVHSPAIRGDRPRIAGTRVTVRTIARAYKAGMSPEETADEIPHIRVLRDGGDQSPEITLCLV